jgi:hypothetical protein
VLDERCERKIADFMDRHGDGFRLPIPTSELIPDDRSGSRRARPLCRSARRRGRIHRLFYRS